MNMAIRKTPNADADGSIPTDVHGKPTAWCEYCGNEGVVMLEGSEIVGGIEYSRGSAPCPWCEQGRLRYTEWTAPTGIQKGTDRQGGKHLSHHRRIEAASDFTMYDVLPTGPDPKRSETFRPTTEWVRQREADGCSRGGLWLALGKYRATAWPPDWPVPAQSGVLDTDATDAQKRELALEAKNAAEREQA